MATSEKTAKKTNRLITRIQEDLEELKDIMGESIPNNTGGGNSGMEMINNGGTRTADPEDDDDDDDEENTFDASTGRTRINDRDYKTEASDTNNGQGAVKHPETDRRLMANQGQVKKPKANASQS